MKAAEAYRTITEVAEELALPAHVLRFWETKFPQIQPLKRGGGRRYYKPEDIQRLRLIQDLLHNQGYTIKGAQKVLAGAANAPQPVPAAPPSASSGVTDEKSLKTIRDELSEMLAALKKPGHPG